MKEGLDFAAIVAPLTTGELTDVSHIGGYANDTYAITVSTGERFAVRFLVDATPRRAREEVAMQIALDAAGIRTPVSLDLGNGDVVGDCNGHKYTVSRFIDGAYPTVVTHTLIRNLGRLTAEIHLAARDIVMEGEGWLNPLCVRAELKDFPDVEFGHQLEQMSNDASFIFDRDLPVANIHGDIWIENVFTIDDEITAVFDFECAERNLRILDLTRTALSLSHRLEGDVRGPLQGLIEGYETVTPLTSREKDVVLDAYRHVTVASAAWNFRNGFEEYARTTFRHALDL